MKTAVILGSGPSLTAEQIDAARVSGHFTIVVNATYKVMLDANVLYGGDFMFWKAYMADVRKVFKGALWTQDASVAARWQINRIRGTNRDGLGLNNAIHLNGNSGAQAINLAFLWGYKRVVLLGFDMKFGPGGERHHHTDHPAPCVQSQVFFEWIHKIDRMARDLRLQNIEVLNATPGSALKCFPMVNYREVLQCPLA